MKLPDIRYNEPVQRLTPEISPEVAARSAMAPALALSSGLSDVARGLAQGDAAVQAATERQLNFNLALAQDQANLSAKVKANDARVRVAGEEEALSQQYVAGEINLQQYNASRDRALSGAKRELMAGVSSPYEQQRLDVEWEGLETTSQLGHIQRIGDLQTARNAVLLETLTNQATGEMAADQASYEVASEELEGQIRAHLSPKAAQQAVITMKGQAAHATLSGMLARGEYDLILADIPVEEGKTGRFSDALDGQTLMAYRSRAMAAASAGRATADHYTKAGLKAVRDKMEAGETVHPEAVEAYNEGLAQFEGSEFHAESRIVSDSYEWFREQPAAVTGNVLNLSDMSKRLQDAASQETDPISIARIDARKGIVDATIARVRDDPIGTYLDMTGAQPPQFFIDDGAGGSVFNPDVMKEHMELSIAASNLQGVEASGMLTSEARDQLLSWMANSSPEENARTLGLMAEAGEAAPEIFQNELMHLADHDETLAGQFALAGSLVRDRPGVALRVLETAAAVEARGGLSEVMTVPTMRGNVLTQMTSWRHMAPATVDATVTAILNDHAYMNTTGVDAVDSDIMKRYRGEEVRVGGWGALPVAVPYGEDARQFEMFWERSKAELLEEHLGDAEFRMEADTPESVAEALRSGDLVPVKVGAKEYAIVAKGTREALALDDGSVFTVTYDGGWYDRVYGQYQTKRAAQ